MVSFVEWSGCVTCVVNFCLQSYVILASAGSWIGVRTFHCQHDFGFDSRGFTTNISHSVLLVYAMLFQSSCNNGYAEVGRWSVANITIWIEISGNSPMLLML